MTRAPAPRGRALRLRTEARPDFQPVKIQREHWLNPESPGDVEFITISLPCVSMYLSAVREVSP